MRARGLFRLVPGIPKNILSKFFSSYPTVFSWSVIPQASTEGGNLKFLKCHTIR